MSYTCTAMIYYYTCKNYNFSCQKFFYHTCLLHLSKIYNYSSKKSYNYTRKVSKLHLQTFLNYTCQQLFKTTLGKSPRFHLRTFSNSTRIIEHVKFQITSRGFKFTLVKRFTKFVTGPAFSGPSNH